MNKNEDLKLACHYESLHYQINVNSRMDTVLFQMKPNA